MSSRQRLDSLLESFAMDRDGVYCTSMPAATSDQDAERSSRARIADRQVDDYLEAIARNHSIPVMDSEVERFLAALPRGALILDIGGCWGWHWRRLAARPDLAVLIIDFVRANLLHARTVLGPLVGTQVALMNADATALPFPDALGTQSGFDGVWTVQVFQHIPDFARACREARRVLRSGGRFITYSLHITPLNRAIYRAFGRSLHVEGMVENACFHLNRANAAQKRIVAEVFLGEVEDRYTECLFHPDLKLTRSGRHDSLLGRLDSRLGAHPWLGRWIARQRSFATVKR